MDGRARGTSIPELLMVLCIIALVSVLSFPGFATIGASSEALQFSQLMQRSLSYARGKAVGTGERVTLCASTDNQRCQRDWDTTVNLLVFTDRNKNYQLDENDSLHRSQQLTLRHGVAHWRGSLGRPYMRYRVDGSAVEYGRYTYCPASGEDQHFRQLVVNRVGRAYQHHDGGGKITDCQ